MMNKITNYKELSNANDMLKGNINRMCVTDDYEEIKQQFAVAVLRLNDIYSYNVNRIMEKKAKLPKVSIKL